MFLQPAASLFTGGGWERQPTELQSTLHPPPSRSADFQPVPGTPQALYTPPFLTSPDSVWETDILEME